MRAIALGSLFLLLSFLTPSSPLAHEEAAPAEIPLPLIGGHDWNGEEKETIRSLWIGGLPAPPEDPSNRYSESLEAARLGEKLFFDSRFSAATIDSPGGRSMTTGSAITTASLTGTTAPLLPRLARNSPNASKVS